MTQYRGARRRTSDGTHHSPAVRFPGRSVGAFCAVLFALSACAASQGASTTTRRTDRSVITREEIAQRSFDNMHSVVTSLRSEWLRPSLAGSGVGSTSATAPP